MAGIEKVCEYSGEYPGPDMYRIKRNHIQIMPEYRKQFRYHPHVLFWLKPEFKWVYRSGGVTFYEPSRIDFYNPPFATVAEYERRFHLRRRLEYWFVLYVPTLPGNVAGEYVNHTLDRSATRRRLKRMLRCRRLNEVEIDTTIDEFEIKDWI